MGSSGDVSSVVVGPSPLKILGKVAIASIAGTAGLSVLIVFMGFLGTPWLLLHAKTIIACMAAVAACYCVIAPLVAALGGRPHVEIGPDGFVTRGITGSRSRRWSDIHGDFAVVKVRFQSMVAYRLTDAFKESRTRISPSASPAGYDEAIIFCGELTIAAGELAEVLNQWQQGVARAARRN